MKTGLSYGVVSRGDVGGVLMDNSESPSVTFPRVTRYAGLKIPKSIIANQYTIFMPDFCNLPLGINAGPFRLFSSRVCRK